MENYWISVKVYQRRYKEIFRLVTNAVLTKYEIEKALWNRSAKFYNENPVLAP